MTWLSGFESIVRPDVPLRDHTWYRLGGTARWMCAPHDAAQLACLIQRLGEARIPWRMLGRGANVIVRDEGFDGAVIRLSEPAFAAERYTSEGLHAGAGLDFPKLIRRTLDRGRVGLEALAGIPGTLGGVIRMNAGGRHGEIGQFARGVEVIDSDGQQRELSAEQVAFRYRHTDLAGMIVVGATLALPEGDAAAAIQRHRDIWREKFNSQPPLAERSAGCIFKNPPGGSAGRLLDEAGLKNASVGGARISERHANFIVAEASACASDVLRLIDMARERVAKAFNVELKLEVEVW